MRICMVTSAPLPPREGIGFYVWNLSRFLVQQGHQVAIVTRGQRGEPAYEGLAGISIRRPRFYPLYPLHVHLHGLFVQRLVRQLEPEVDLIHLHSPLVPPVRSSRPMLVTVHSTRVGAARDLRVTGVGSLLTRLQVPVSIQIERQTFAQADQIAVVARSVATDLARYDVGKKPAAVLGNGVDTDVFSPDGANTAGNTGGTYVLAAGRLAPGKGFEDLIESMGQVAHRFPNACLSIAGAGPLEKPLRARIGQMGLDRTVRLLGHVGKRAEMVALYRGATAFAHASHHEGLPTVLLEAMACEKGIVCTAAGGAVDAVTDGVNGLLVPPGAPTVLAEAIGRLLDDTRLRTRLGAAARRTVEDRYSWQAVGSNYERAYQALLHGRAPGECEYVELDSHLQGGRYSCIRA